MGGPWDFSDSPETKFPSLFGFDWDWNFPWGLSIHKHLPSLHGHSLAIRIQLPWIVFLRLVQLVHTKLFLGALNGHNIVFHCCCFYCQNFGQFLLSSPSLLSCGLKIIDHVVLYSALISCEAQLNTCTCVLSVRPSVCLSVRPSQNRNFPDPLRVRFSFCHAQGQTWKNKVKTRQKLK